MYLELGLMSVFATTGGIYYCINNEIEIKREDIENCFKNIDLKITQITEKIDLKLEEFINSLTEEEKNSDNDEEENVELITLNNQINTNTDDEESHIELGELSSKSSSPISLRKSTTTSPELSGEEEFILLYDNQ